MNPKGKSFGGGAFRERLLYFTLQPKKRCLLVALKTPYVEWDSWNYIICLGANGKSLIAEVER